MGRQRGRGNHPSQQERALRCVVIDHRSMVRSSYADALVTEGLRATPAPPDRQHALDAIFKKGEPAVALITLDTTHGGTIIDLIESAADAGARVIALTDGDVSQVTIAEALAAGAVGYVSVEGPVEDVVRAVGAAASEQPVISPNRRAELDILLRRHQAEITLALQPFLHLTPREESVLQSLMQGKRVEDIAEADYVSVCTVRSHVRSILTKLDVHSQLEAVAMAHNVEWLPQLAS